MFRLHFSCDRGTQHHQRGEKMSTGQITAWIVGAIGFLSLFIEISKVKINPISSLLGWIGKRLTIGITEKMEKDQKEIREELKAIKDAQEILEKKIEELSVQEAIDAADSIKFQIFQFYHELQKPNIRHSEAEFNQIIALNAKYEELLKKTKQPNGVYKAEFEYIMQVYKQCQATNDFDVRGKK